MVRQTFLHKLQFPLGKSKTFFIAIFGLVIIGSNISKGNEFIYEKRCYSCLVRANILGFKIFWHCPLNGDKTYGCASLVFIRFVGCSNIFRALFVYGLKSNKKRVSFQQVAEGVITIQYA